MDHSCGGNIKFNEDKGCFHCDHCEIETMQPERSKREDSLEIPRGQLEFVNIDGKVVVRRVCEGKIVPMRCGALDSMETC